MRFASFPSAPLSPEAGLSTASSEICAASHVKFLENSFSLHSTPTALEASHRPTPPPPPTPTPPPAMVKTGTACRPPRRCRWARPSRFPSILARCSRAAARIGKVGVEADWECGHRLTLASAPSITSGAGILECVTMVWLACFGVLLFLAEWDCMACVKKLPTSRFRSGRAALAFLSGTFCLAAALDVDTCSQVYYYYGRSAYTLRLPDRGRRALLRRRLQHPRLAACARAQGGRSPPRAAPR